MKNKILLLLLLLPLTVMGALTTSEKKERIRQAEADFKAGRYDDARGLYLEIYIEGGNEKKYQDLKELCENLAELASDAQKAINKGDYEEALKKYEEIKRLNPDDNNVISNIEKCKRQLSASELDDRMSSAARLFRDGKYDEAYYQYYQISQNFNDTDASGQATLCHTCQQLQSQAREAANNGDYAVAIARYDELLQKNPADTNAKTERERCAQTRKGSELLAEARSLFKNGNYREAKSRLEQFKSTTGMTDSQLETNITNALRYSELADQAYTDGEYDKAILYYNEVLNANGEDTYAYTRLNSAKKMAEDKKAPATGYAPTYGNGTTNNSGGYGNNGNGYDPGNSGYVGSNKNTYNTKPVKEKKPSGEFPLKPNKNRFRMFVNSGFTKRNAFGGGIGASFSYFLMDIDFVGAMYVNDGIQDGYRSEYISKEDIKNVVTVEKGVYEQSKFQFAISPGVNLKYFSVKLGLGMMFDKQLTVEDFNELSDYYSGETNTVSHFLIRPAIEGNIPVFKDYSGGIIVGMGYNVVAGRSELNGLLFTLGMFF